MRTVVYRPGEDPGSLNAGGRGVDLSSLVDEVGVESPGLADMADSAVDGLEEDSIAYEQVGAVLADFERGHISLAVAKRRVKDLYRQNLPEDVPVDAAVEGPYPG